MQGNNGKNVVKARKRQFFIDYQHTCTMAGGVAKSSFFVSFFHRFFAFNSGMVNVWNSLSKGVVTAPSLRSFKNWLDKYWNHLRNASLKLNAVKQFSRAIQYCQMPSLLFYYIFIIMILLWCYSDTCMISGSRPKEIGSPNHIKQRHTQTQVASIIHLRLAIGD